MKNVILFDDEQWEALLPLTYTRPVAELRVGILTIREKWEKLLNASIGYITQDYLSEKFPFHITDDNYIINSTILPTPYILSHVESLNLNSVIVWGDTLIAARMDRTEFESLKQENAVENLVGEDIQSDDEAFYQISRPQDIFKLNEVAISLDFDLVTHDRKTEKVGDDNRLVHPENIFIEEGVDISNAILNASKGPIYIGKNASILDGAMIRGPFAMLNDSVVKMGAKIYGPTTIGPASKVGGELNNVVIQGNSNKAHDGYLGNAVLGEWCNLGADTNNSNLKNNYSNIRLYDYRTERFEPTGMQFCGLIMGDHSKCGINTMLNTGTVVGVGANIFGSGYPRNFIPSFSWGGAHGYKTNRIEKMLEVAEIVIKRRKIELSEEDIYILKHVYHYSARFRSWE